MPEDFTSTLVQAASRIKAISKRYHLAMALEVKCAKTVAK
jgi:hypothetical protein